MLKKYNPYIIVFYVLSAASLVLAIFFDLKLDIALNNPDDAFAIWFRNTGEIPSRMVCPLAGAVLVMTAKNKIEKIAGYVFCMGGSAYLGYYLSSYFLFKVDNHTKGEMVNIIYGIVYGIGVGVIILMVTRLIHIPKRMQEPLRKIAIISIVVMFLQIAIIEGSKYLWGRVRFRDLLKVGSYEQFTPWYKINGINGNKSFPSGHTAGAAMSYLLMFMPYISKKWEKRQAVCFAVPLVYSSIVAYTRLVMGAHYLSDVTMGGIVSFTIVIIAIRVYEKKLMNHNFTKG